MEEKIKKDDFKRKKCYRMFVVIAIFNLMYMHSMGAQRNHYTNY